MSSTTAPAREGSTETPEPTPVLLLGDEAVALGALHAGLSAAYGYPGTPSTEIFEAIEAASDEFDVTAHWCTNEKTAMEQGLGASMAGRRALVTMKHVGLNVAMDPFVNSALLDIRGGLVVAVADDPGMHSSQNEQDSRVLAEFARIPCLEPGSQQEAYAMARDAFDLSEGLGVPVVLRLVTRLCHGRAPVVAGEPRRPRPRGRVRNPAGWTLLPANARRLWDALLARREEMEAAVARWSSAVDAGGDSGRREGESLGIVTAGIARSHYLENVAGLDESHGHVHVGAYPLPTASLRDLANRVDRILVLEEGYPLVERALAGILDSTCRVDGKLSGALPEAGELGPDVVRAALGLSARQATAAPSLSLPTRPPQLCRGCPHRDAFEALREAMTHFDDVVVAGDIGCYTLGALPPYEAIESCVCMGASVGMAKGVADAGLGPAVAVIGDSTFLHSGIPGLIDAAQHDAPLTVLILDNQTVAMTGQQPTSLPDSRLGSLVLATGVDPEHVHVFEAHPKKTNELAGLLRREMEHVGTSVVIAVRECVEAARKRKKGARS